MTEPDCPDALDGLHYWIPRDGRLTKACIHCGALALLTKRERVEMERRRIEEDSERLG